MKSVTSHPEDFSPYLDRDLSDPRYEELSLHLMQCPRCAEEIRDWQANELMFRSSELEIEVPTFQWNRVRAGLEAQLTPSPWWKRPFGFIKPRRLALQAAFAAVLLMTATVLGLQYRKYLEAQDLVALAAYSESEAARLKSSQNPFTSLEGSAAGSNPFANLRDSGNINPFTNR